MLYLEADRNALNMFSAYRGSKGMLIFCFVFFCGVAI